MTPAREPGADDDVETAAPAAPAAPLAPIPPPPPTIAQMVTALKSEVWALGELALKFETQGDSVKKSKYEKRKARVEAAARLLELVGQWTDGALLEREAAGVIRKVLDVPRGPVFVAALHKVRDELAAKPVELAPQ